jgi:hypothetical protein
MALDGQSYLPGKGMHSHGNYITTIDRAEPGQVDRVLHQFSFALQLMSV